MSQYLTREIAERNLLSDLTNIGPVSGAKEESVGFTTSSDYSSGDFTTSEGSSPHGNGKAKLGDEDENTCSISSGSPDSDVDCPPKVVLAALCGMNIQ